MIQWNLGDFSWGAANGGVTNGGLRGVWPKSAFFALFRPFPEGVKSTWETVKTEEKGLFPQISSDLLKPPSLKPPFAAPQTSGKFEKFREKQGTSVGIFPGGFRGSAGFSGNLGLWGGFGRFGASKGFCANSQPATVFLGSW